MPIDTDHSYPVPAHEATLRLETFLSQKIQNNGALSFQEYMQHALYHPEYGYYTRGAQNIGKSGDFFTSVSVGKCFGNILAHRLHQIWIKHGTPTDFHLIEIAANNGQLARDILDTIQSIFPDFYKNLTYHIIEHLESIREVQTKILIEHKDKLSQHSSTSEISESHGVILSNELVDALPFHLLQLENGEWHERCVDLENGSFIFQLSALDPQLSNFCKNLPKDLPNGYQTEYRSGIDDHIKEITNMLEHCHTITIDYGHSHSSYYAPSRKTGTLRCYHQHQADENPLEKPGLKDITAHVNFTQLAKAYLQKSYNITHFSSQSHYLTTHAKDWLLHLEENLSSENFKLIRQFQTLTHPTTMGHQFHVLETNNTPLFKTDPVALERLEISVQNYSESVINVSRIASI